MEEHRGGDETHRQGTTLPRGCGLKRAVMFVSKASGNAIKEFSVQTLDIESLGGSALDAGDGEGEDGEDLGELHVGACGWCVKSGYWFEEGDVVILEAMFSMLQLSMSRLGEEKACYLSFSRV